MKRVRLLVGLILCAVVQASAQTPAPTPPPSSLPPTVLGVPTDEAVLDFYWKSIAVKDPRLASREIMSFCLRAAALKWHPERIGIALQLLQSMQDKDPKSPTYGNFTWYVEQTKPVDQNAAEFTMENGAQLWKFYHDQLAAPDRERLRAIIELAVHGIENHKVPVEYTNIFLMSTWNRIAIGEEFGLKDFAEEGYQHLDQWIDFTYENGLTEYNSPTYVGVDIDQLALIRKYAGRPNGRLQAEAALRYLWLVCRTNWSTLDMRLTGAHSRDYDYRTGHGFLDWHAHDWGLMPTFRLSVVDWYPNFKETAWSPAPADIAGYAAAWAAPRFIWQKCGAKPEKYATNYVGETTSIGVAGSGSGSDDKVFAINFGGGPGMAMGNVFMDGRGDGYGTKPEKLKDNHVKTLHLTSFVASAQKGPNVLLLESWDPAHKQGWGPDATCLNTQFDFPIQAAVWQHDQPLVVPDGGSRPLDPAAPIFLRYEQMAVGLQSVQATDDAGKSIAPTYYNDGAAIHVARLSWAQAAGVPKGEAHVILLATVAENLDDAGFAKFRADFAKVKTKSFSQGGKIMADVTLADQTALSLNVDTIANTRETSTAQPDGILQVNGVEMGRPVLAEAQKIRSATVAAK